MPSINNDLELAVEDCTDRFWMQCSAQLYRMVRIFKDIMVWSMSRRRGEQRQEHTVFK